MSQQTHSEQSDSPAYRYEATIKLVIAADGQDLAWRIAKAAAKAAKVEGVEDTWPPMLDLRYSPGLTGKARCSS
jgi:beta-glucosidase-like glycosyl hydrolase